VSEWDLDSLRIRGYFGTVGGVLFFGRFHVQWIVSGWRKESVIPIARISGLNPQPWSTESAGRHISTIRALPSNKTHKSVIGIRE
jgi:hypothetical protein